MDKRDVQHATRVGEHGVGNHGPGSSRQVMARNRFLGKTEFTARCSCGWNSRPQVSRNDAENEATEHVRYVLNIVGEE